MWIVCAAHYCYLQFQGRVSKNPEIPRNINYPRFYYVYGLWRFALNCAIVDQYACARVCLGRLGW